MQEKQISEKKMVQKHMGKKSSCACWWRE